MGEQWNGSPQIDYKPYLLGCAAFAADCHPPFAAAP
jgi:hypothetical protein